MATQGTGREMEKKGQESSENFTAMLLTGEKNMAIAAIAWFPDVSSFFLFSIFFFFQRARATAKQAKKIKPFAVTFWLLHIPLLLLVCCRSRRTVDKIEDLRK